MTGVQTCALPISRLCHEPRVAVLVLTEMLSAYLVSGQLKLLLEHKVLSTKTINHEVRSVMVINLKSKLTEEIKANFFVDATELGDLLPLTGTAYVTGTESKAETGELHAPEKTDAENNQSFTMCFAMDYQHGENHVIEKPKEYNFWKDHIPPLEPKWSGKLLEQIGRAHV